MATDSVEVTCNVEKERELSITAWKSGSVPDLSLPKPLNPLLPSTDRRNVIVTSEFSSVSVTPHFGTIVGTVLSADVCARYYKQRGYNTLYVSGISEFGPEVELKAFKKEATLQEFCDKSLEIHRKLYKWFHIDFDVFGRTNTERHTRMTQGIFHDLVKSGLVYEEHSMEQLHCHACNKVLADAIVRGTCSKCSYAKAHGDQCEGCGLFLTAAVELKFPRCKHCSDPPSRETSSHLLLNLSKLQEPLHEWFKKASGNQDWSSRAQLLAQSYIQEGLKDTPITRDLSWGVPVPYDGFNNKVFYSVLDEPFGYMSVTAGYTDQWEKWWKNPKEVQLHQFISKEKIVQHSILSPATLIGSGTDYTLPTILSTTEPVGYEEGTFSLKKGFGVFGADIMTTGVPADLYRFYLISIRPETEHSSFNWSDFALTVNTQLINNIGNFVNRTLVFIEDNYKSIVPELHRTEGVVEYDIQLFADLNGRLKSYTASMERSEFRNGLKHVVGVSKIGSDYINKEQPWRLMMNNRSRAGTVMNISVNIVYLISVLIHPFTPAISKDILNQLKVPSNNIAIPDFFAPFIKPGHVIGEPRSLFMRLDDSMVSMLKDKHSGKYFF